MAELNEQQQSQELEPERSEFAAVRDRLAEIADAVDDESLSLDDALDLYEEAVALGLQASDLLETGVVVPEGEPEGELAETSEDAAVTADAADAAVTARAAGAADASVAAGANSGSPDSMQATDGETPAAGGPRPEQAVE